jgi:hypothetical protein
MNGWSCLDKKREEIQKELNSHVSYVCLRLSMGQELDTEDLQDLVKLERKFRRCGE